MPPERPDFEYEDRRIGRGRRESDQSWMGFSRQISLGNLITIGCVLAGAAASVLTWGGHAASVYADERVWQKHVEDLRQSDVEKQALRDDAILARLGNIEQRLEIMDSRLNARGK